MYRVSLSGIDLVDVNYVSRSRTSIKGILHFFGGGK